MAHRNRWFTVLKNGWIFHGELLNSQRVYNFICGFILSFLSPISGYIRYTRGILVHFMYEGDGVWAWSKRNGMIHQVMIYIYCGGQTWSHEIHVGHYILLLHFLEVVYYTAVWDILGHGLFHLVFKLESLIWMFPKMGVPPNHLFWCFFPL